MGILSGFFSEDLAIDLGTVNTIVYAPAQGVVSEVLVTIETPSPDARCCVDT